VHFEATASDDLKWKFTPQQRFVKVLPGETALAFYTAENWGKEDVVGIATYNITPSRVSLDSVIYFTTNISSLPGLIPGVS
jgi:cytochrome c oxidase assembly protein subunit 11